MGKLKSEFFTRRSFYPEVPIEPIARPEIVQVLMKKNSVVNDRIYNNISPPENYRQP